MKKDLLYLLIILLLGFGMWHYYHKPPDKIKVPAIVGSIKPAPITYLEPKGEPLQIEWRGTTIESKNPVNDSLIAVYRDSLGKYQDSIRDIRRFQMFVDLATIRKGQTYFEDENIKMKVAWEVTGYMNSISISHYEIKEREIEKKGLGIDISLQAGYGISGNGLSPYVGIGVSKPILRL